jgi:predicted nucleotidyltransferase
VEHLAERHPEIEEVWLFGSLARGDAVPGSDADLLIVVGESQDDFLDRSVRYQPEHCGIAVDVLAYTRSELVTMEQDHASPVHGVLREGVCLYRRPSRQP